MIIKPRQKFNLDTHCIICGEEIDPLRGQQFKLYQIDNRHKLVGEYAKDILRMDIPCTVYYKYCSQKCRESVSKAGPKEIHLQCAERIREYFDWYLT